MKKILSCILVLVMLLAMVTACGNRDNNQNDDTPTLTEAVNYFHNIYKDKSAATVTDFDVVGQVMLKGVRFTVTWTSSDDRVTIKESSKAGFYTVDLPDVNDAEFNYTLTATISDPDGNSEQKSYTFNMLAVDNSAVVTEPVANVAYKIFLVQSSYGQRLFALNTTQNNENKFINTSNDPKTAADFYAEAVEGGYKFSTEIDGVKNYLYAKTTVDESTGNVSKYIGYSATESTVFTYNSSIGGVWTTLIGGVSYGVGTYGSYKTICLSEATYYSTSTVGTTQFVMSLMTSEYAETLAPEEEVVVTEPANGSTLTIPEANELGEKFAHDLYTKGKFYVTGTVKNIESTQYGNMYIEDENGNTLYVYGVYDADGTNRYDAMDPQPAVGDTVKLYGIIGYYTDKAQMKNAWAVELNGEALGGGTQGGETGDSYGLVTELKTGDKVVIGAPAYGKLLSVRKAQSNSYYNMGVDYTPSSFGNVTNDEIFVVTVNADGSYTFTSVSGTVIALADEYSSLNADGDNTAWTLEAKAGAEGIFYIKNVVRGNYLEWYDTQGNWSTYSTSSLTDMFELSFYLAGASGDVGGETGGETGGNNGEENPEFTTAAEIINAAYQLEPGESLSTSVTLTGIITEITEAYSSQYKNITLVMVIGDMTDKPLVVYRLSGTGAEQIAVGDEITVTGTIVNYAKYNDDGSLASSTIEFTSGCTLDSWVDKTTDEGGETGGETKEVTIPAALDLADGTVVIVTGIVSQINSSWNTTYNNMDITIRDDEGNTLYIFRIGTQVGLGDTIIVTGTMATYNGARQIAAGATAVIGTVHGDNHTYANGKCTVCGTPEPVAGEEIVNVDFSTVATGVQYADESYTFGSITVSTHNKGCHINTQLRIYDSSTNNGWAIVTSNDVITSLTVNAGNNPATLNVYGSTDGETWVLIQAVTTTTSYANYTVDIDESLGYTYLKLDAAGAQIRVANLSVTVVKKEAE